MNVLWIVNIVFPEALERLGMKTPHASSGGWMLATAEDLIKVGHIKLCVVSVSREVKELKRIEGVSILYYLIPYGKGNTRINSEYNSYFSQIKDDFKPDIVHIHGTEFSHGFSFLESCGCKNVVVSIQGLLSVIAEHYIDGISDYDVNRTKTFCDYLKHTGIKDSQERLRKRSVYEKSMLQNVKHVIGRTSWDKAHVWAINPNVYYHSCNEALRSAFYGKEWKYEECNKHTIFLSQVSTPIKGFHQVLKALPMVLRVYPNVQVRIAGYNPTRSLSFSEKIRLTGYGNLLKWYIGKFGLADHITFLGNLEEDEMVQEYLKANLFLMPSSIENSPNSLGEAQLVGCPCLASYVGGVEDMIPNTDCGLIYRFDDVEMLAFRICEIFEKSQIFNNKEMRRIAEYRHNRMDNLQVLLSIYEKVKECK